MDRACLASLGSQNGDAAFHTWLRDVSPKSGSPFPSPGLTAGKPNKMQTRSVELPDLGMLSSPISTGSGTDAMMQSAASCDQVQKITNLWGTGAVPRCMEFCYPEIYFTALKLEKELPYMTTPQPTEITHGSMWIFELTCKKSISSSYNDGKQWQTNSLGVPNVNTERINLKDGHYVLVSHCTSADGEMQRRTYVTPGGKIAIVHYLNSGVVASAHARALDNNPFAAFETGKVQPPEPHQQWGTHDITCEDLLKDIGDIDMLDNSKPADSQEGLPKVQCFPTIVEQGSSVIMLLPPALRINVPLGFCVKICDDFVPTTQLSEHNALTFTMPAVPNHLIKRNEPTDITVELTSAGHIFSQPTLLKYRPSLLSGCFQSTPGGLGWNSTLGEGLISILREINSKVSEVPVDLSVGDPVIPDFFRNNSGMVRTSSSFDNLMAHTQQKYPSEVPTSSGGTQFPRCDTPLFNIQHRDSLWGIGNGNGSPCPIPTPSSEVKGKSPRSRKVVERPRGSRSSQNTKLAAKSPPFTSQSSQQNTSRKSGELDPQPTVAAANEEQVRLRKLFFSIIHAVVTENQHRPADRDFLFAPDSEGITLVHYCAYLGLIGPLDVLLAYAPEGYVNIPDKRGMSPLHYSVMKDHNEAAIAVLLQAGGDYSQQDNQGNTPFSIAAELSNPGIRLMRDSASHMTPGSATTDFSLEDELLSQLSMFTGSTSMGHHHSGEEWDALDALDSITLASEPLSHTEGDQEDQSQALIIQRNVRKWSAQRQYNLVRRSIETLQAAVRGRMARKEIDRLRKVLTIQRTVRQWLKKRGLSPNGETDKRLKAVGKTHGSVVSVSTPKTSPMPVHRSPTKDASEENGESGSDVIELDIKLQMDAEASVQSDVRQWLQRGQQQEMVRRSNPACSSSSDQSLSEQLQESERQRACLQQQLQHEESRQEFRAKLDANLEKICLLQRNFRKFLRAKPRENDNRLIGISTQFDKIMDMQRATREWLASK
eukprot:TRINITY_DN15261_c0_g1_i2.p1 TRINITY_DN15261_c0_g1~~TRINITY_DN15261_c0_g1_i2.p1  ORF type:complete len:993 (+),score=150.09 TRINITY_DN15261_c0_g1_i2:46-3024(+)